MLDRNILQMSNPVCDIQWTPCTEKLFAIDIDSADLILKN